MEQVEHIVPVVKGAGQDNKEKQMRKLWKAAFEDSEAYMDFYFETVRKLNHVFIVMKDEELASMLHCNPYCLSCGKDEINAYYIVGVATKTAFRRQGLMRKLMMSAFEWMWQQKTPFCYLRPAKEAYYTPFGFTSIEQLKMHGITKEELYAIPGLLSFEQATEEEKKEIVSWSNHSLSKNCDLYIKRSTDYLEVRQTEMASEGGAIFFIRPEKEIEAVIFLMWDEEKQCYVIEDCVGTMQPEERQRPIVEEVPLMVRIIHLHSFLTGLRATKPTTCEIHVKDNLIPENTRGYHLTISESECQVKQIPWKEECAVPVEQFVIEMFGRQSLTFGYRRLHLREIV